MADPLSAFFSGSPYSAQALSKTIASSQTGEDLKAKYAKYRYDCLGYVIDVLKITPTDQQAAIYKKLPGRVKINSGHSVGKTSSCASVLSWWYDTRDPSWVITTAPTSRDVEQLLWTEVRLQRARAGLITPYIGPKAAAIYDHEEHQAMGFTARSGNNFVGRHRPHMCFLMDEADLIESIYWTTTNTMYQPDPEMDHCWIAIGNPVTTDSQSYLEDIAVDLDGKPKWQVYNLSSLDHPNIAAALRGERPPIPDAVSLAQVNDWVGDWCDPVNVGDDIMPMDFEWTPGSGRWFRPGPQFLARALGIRPTSGVNTVLGASDWERAIAPKFSPQFCWESKFGITIGVDPAEFGDDQTAIHIRTGPLSLHHEEHNGWAQDQTAKRLWELSVEWCAWYNRQATMERPHLIPDKVKVIIELDGMGSGVMSHHVPPRDWSGFKASEASEILDVSGKKVYYNKKAEMWFEGRKKARKGMLDLSRLPKNVLAKLRLQLLAPSYRVDRFGGTLLVESKEEVKARLKRSPDSADAFLTSHMDTSASYLPTIVGADPEKDSSDWRYLRAPA